MKSIYSISLVFLLSFCLLACKDQEAKDNSSSLKKITILDSNNIIAGPEAPVNPYAQVDLSPMDMSYFPTDYPKLKMSNPDIAPPLARVVYSRPHLQGRKLFTSVLKYGEPWRLGANEATELQLFKEANIMGEKVKPGRYILYCIPEPDKWTIILNSNIDSWGLIPDSTKDIAHFTIPSQTNNSRLEFFSMVFEKTTTGAELLMAWDNVEAKLPISF